MKVKIFDSTAISIAKMDNTTLTIHFTSGGVYKYLDVPEEESEGLFAASSAGHYYSTKIRGKYKTERVE